VRSRFAWFYAAAWLILYLLYTVMLVANPGTSLLAAQIAAFFTVVPAAILGLMVWWFCSRIPWNEQRKIAFFAIHMVGAIVYTSVWTGFTVAEIAAYQPQEVFNTFLERAMGWQAIMGLLIYGVIAGVEYLVQVSERLAEQRVLAGQAELMVLRSQLNPHFLFNTLHSITTLAGDDPAAVEGALVQFGSLLRYALDAGSRGDDDATLEDELRFVRGYLDLEKLRLGSRLTVVEDIDPDTLDCLVPVLTIQPIVENAVRHSIAPRANGGAVKLTSRLVDDMVIVEVHDDGNGATPEAIANGGTGLSLITKRIQGRFAGRGSTSIDSAGSGFTVRLSMPAVGTREAAS
jgi:two-component system LytT family sensor kinase